MNRPVLAIPTIETNTKNDQEKDNCGNNDCNLCSGFARDINISVICFIYSFKQVDIVVENTSKVLCSLNPLIINCEIHAALVKGAINVRIAGGKPIDILILVVFVNVRIRFRF